MTVSYDDGVDNVADARPFSPKSNMSKSASLPGGKLLPKINHRTPKDTPTGKWPAIKCPEDLPVPNPRVRALVCSCPSHFCYESLIIVPQSSEPISAPYRIATCIDLRSRKEDTRNKAVYLVAYDLDSLRKSTMGAAGIDPFQVADSWIARDSVCSDLVPIRRPYGEYHINLYPPNAAEGEVLMLLRLVTVGDPGDRHDWRPLGDAVLLRVEPRITNYDKEYIRNLESQIDAGFSGREELHEELEGIQPKYLKAFEESKTLKASLATLRFENDEAKATTEQLQGTIEKLAAQLKSTESSEASTEQQLRTALDESKRRLESASHAAELKSSAELDQAQKELNIAQEEVNRMKEKMDRLQQEAEEAKKKAQKAKSALTMSAAVGKTHRQEAKAAQSKKPNHEEKLGLFGRLEHEVKADFDSVQAECELVKAELALVKAENAQLKERTNPDALAALAQAVPVTFAGAVPDYCADALGTFKPNGDTVNRHPVYNHTNGRAQLLKTAEGWWHVAVKSDEGFQAGVSRFCAGEMVVDPLKCSSWYILGTEGAWELCEGLTCTAL